MNACGGASVREFKITFLTTICYERALLPLLSHDLEHKQYMCVRVHEILIRGAMHDFSSIPQRMSLYGLNLWLVTPTILSPFSIFVPYWRRSGGHYTVISNPWVSAKATCGERGSNRLHTYGCRVGQRVTQSH